MEFAVGWDSIKTKLGLWLRGIGNLVNTCLKASGEKVCRAPRALDHKPISRGEIFSFIKQKALLAWNFAQLNWSQKTCLDTLTQGLSNRP